MHQGSYQVLLAPQMQNVQPQYCPSCIKILTPAAPPPPLPPSVPKYWGQKSMTYGLQAIAEMAMIKAQGDREQAMSEAEWKQLSNLIENDRRERVRSSHTLDN